MGHGSPYCNDCPMAKPLIKANDKPVVVPKPPPPPPPLRPPPARVVPIRKAEPAMAFGDPLRIVPNPGFKGPSIPGYTFVAAWRVEYKDKQILEFLGTTERIGNVKRMFHGTTAQNVETICKQGLRPGRADCMFGSGIYMGGEQKAIFYTRNASRWSYRDPEVQHAHYLLEVEVALGKIKPCSEAEKHDLKKLQEEGFNSVGGFAGYTASWHGTLRHNEYVVYDPSQVIVLNILEYHSGIPKTDPPIVWTPPGKPTQGPCQVLREKDVVLSAKQRAFKDVLSKQPCGKTSYTPVTYNDGKNTVWLCKDCIKTLKLRSGSMVEIKVANVWGKKPVNKIRLD